VILEAGDGFGSLTQELHHDLVVKSGQLDELLFDSFGLL